MTVAKLAQPTGWALLFLLGGFISTLMGVLLNYLGVPALICIAVVVAVLMGDQRPS
jgi:hypothetical protein